MLGLETPLAPDLPGTDLLQLLSAAQQLAAARELDGVMEVVRRTARGLTGADGTTFVLREGDLVYYADEDAISPLWKGCRFPAGSCISGWAMIHRETVVIEDIYRDERIPHDTYRPTFVAGLAMVPVGVDEPVAAIGAYWARRHRATAHEVRLLEMLAGFAALALANDALVRDLRQAVHAREEFLTVAAHELRTPIAALSLTLRDGAKAGEPGAADEVEVLRRKVARGRRQTARLATLVDVLLDVSRAPHGRIELARKRIDLAGVAAEVVERLGAAGAGLALRSQGPVVGQWDPVRLGQVVENLVANALKFGGGKPVEVSVSRQDGEARLVVSDSGIGIAPEDQGRIFDKFARAVSVTNYGGLGLGLWIVRQNVEAHGGAVAVESRPGAGARFTVTLPLAGRQRA